MRVLHSGVEDKVKQKQVCSELMRRNEKKFSDSEFNNCRVVKLRETLSFLSEKKPSSDVERVFHLLPDLSVSMKVRPAELSTAVVPDQVRDS